MAVFLLKGEHGGAYTPPACTSTIFTDVPCPGGLNVDWINQLSKENVTGGCGGGNYCPLSNVTEWQMATFMSKGPNPYGPGMWPNYHAIPGGSFYTLRDSGNKVTTEFADSYAGRDNVFLGNLLVASYVSNANSGVIGWNFHSSDHLGSIRLSVKGADLSTIEANKYYPFGESYSSTALTQKLAYASMERDPEASHHYDHARHQDYKLGRFAAPDKLGGRASFPQSWNRYSYGSNNPLAYSDPNGLASLPKVATVFRVLSAHSRELIAHIRNPLSNGGLRKLMNAMTRAERPGAGVAVEVEKLAGRKKLAERLAENGAFRGPEKAGAYPEHIHPANGRFADVHIEARESTLGATLLEAAVPFSVGIASDKDATPMEIVSAGLWDVATWIDPIGITSLIESATGLEPLVGSDSQVSDPPPHIDPCALSALGCNQSPPEPQH
jgi:RHS repeat-associated protein